jgi:carbamoyltransferase
VRVLGLSFSGHGSSCCLVEDGRIVSAVNLERLTRHKFSLAALPGYVEFLQNLRVNRYRSEPEKYFDFYEVFPQMLEYVTGVRDLRAARLDLVVKTRDNIGPVEDPGLASLAEEYGRFLEYFSGVRTEFDLEHHLAHAYQAYLCSPFEETAILTVDGSGEMLRRLEGESISTTFAVGCGGEVEVLEEVCFPHTVGGLYSSFTRQLGFRENQEGNTMALAAFGTDHFYRRVADAFTLHDSGAYELQLYADAGGLGIVILEELEAYFPVRLPTDPITDRHKDAAWAVQRICEEVLLNAARGLHRRTGLTRLASAGGVALNCVANARLRAETPFQDLFVMPNAGDRGLAAGCALYGYHRVLGGQTRRPPRHDYLGREYSTEEMRVVLDRTSTVRYRHSADIAAEAATLLASGAIVGWFQGGAEFGPRALGHRSILADPRTPQSKQRLDRDIKKREWFRPYAPSVLHERANEYFCLEASSPYMLLACGVRPEKAGELAGVTHVDGSARVQTVDRKIEPLYHRLITEFASHTGVPVVLNTSFNTNGAPVVETPADAVAALESMHLDALALGDYLVWQQDQKAPPRQTYGH